MLITLPKARRDGKFRMTTILGNAITGIEPATVYANGKAFEGSKVFTARGSFYVLATPQEIAMKWHQMLSTGAMVEVMPLLPVKSEKLPAGTVKLLKECN